jgi:hypothetical protein
LIPLPVGPDLEENLSLRFVRHHPRRGGSSPTLPGWGLAGVCADPENSFVPT